MIENSAWAVRIMTAWRGGPKLTTEGPEKNIKLAMKKLGSDSQIQELLGNKK